MRKGNIVFRIVLFVVIAAAACSLLTGCEANISSYADEKILVKGLADEDFYITPGELAEMECVSATAKGQTQKAGTVTAYGPTLETFVEQYGHTLDDFKSLHTIAKDDYVVTLGRVTWDEHDVILSIANGSKPLTEKHQPLRLVIPGGSSGNWTYSVVEMEFKLKEE